jgi:curved DNA-binding protein CbpA
MTVAISSFYEVLGVAPDADAATIRRAYLEAARAHHPDRHAGDPASAARAESLMRQINEAWAVLGDAQRRAVHDRELARRPAGSSNPSRGRRTNRGGPSPEPPTSGLGASRKLTMLPPVLLFGAILCFAAGAVLRLTPVLAFGLGLAILGGISFVAVPIVTMHRSRR